MIFGDPDVFAIWLDKVDSWSNESFKNGSFGYFLGGELIWSLRSTLGVDVHMLRSTYVMNNSVEDETLFNLPPHMAYKNLCLRAFPSMDSEAEYSDFNNLVSSESLSDEGWNVFLVEFDVQAKIIFGFGSAESSVRQVIVERGYFQKIVKEMIVKFEEYP